jgi:hypothetical protein
MKANSKETFESKLPETTKILKKMFQMVDVKFSSEFIKTPQWFTLHTFTSQQELEFKQWTINYLYTHEKARKELMRTPCRNKEYIEDVVNFFLLGYGWKINDESTKPKGLNTKQSNN